MTITGEELMGDLTEAYNMITESVVILYTLLDELDEKTTNRLADIVELCAVAHNRLIKLCKKSAELICSTTTQNT